jgi:predicted RNase H-like HicB family nuclease
MRQEFTVVIERDEEGWLVAHVPELKGCHTQARTLESLMKRVREVIALCLDEGERPEPLEPVGVQRISV